jgi:hypothetical protein
MTTAMMEQKVSPSLTRQLRTPFYLLHYWRHKLDIQAMFTSVGSSKAEQNTVDNEDIDHT